MTRTTHFFLASALACLVASVFLIQQVKLGIPMSFVMSLIVAGVISLGVPLLATVAYAFLRRGKAGKIIVFELTCLLIAISIGLATF
ncbi:MAG: hypothetical protein AB8G16_10255 [Gammaproteobacteria bacterium]